MQNDLLIYFWVIDFIYLLDSCDLDCFVALALLVRLAMTIRRVDCFGQSPSNDKNMTIRRESIYFTNALFAMSLRIFAPLKFTCPAKL